MGYISNCKKNAKMYWVPIISDNIYNIYLPINIYIYTHIYTHTHIHTYTGWVLLGPFFRWANWGSEMFPDLPGTHGSYNAAKTAFS